MTADRLLVQGRILSFELGETVFRGMMVQHGQVTELSREPLPDSPGCLNLDRHWVVPAFIDSHMHILELGLQSIFPDFAGARSLSEVFDLLSARRAQAREFGFLLGFNIEPDRLQEKRLPLRTELDRVLPERPLLLYRIDGHSASTNSRGLQELQESGIPENGIELDEQREPLGILTAQAYESASRRFKARLGPEIQRLAFRQAADDCRRKGVLTVGALTGTDEPGDTTPELLLEAAPGLPITVALYPQTRDLTRARRLGQGRIGGCILIDGSFGSHTAALLQDYADEPGNPGRLYLTDAELIAFLRSADETGLQTAVHAIGDRAVEQVVRCHESFLSAKPLRHRIEHAELLSGELIRRIARLGLVLGVQPAFEAAWGGAGRMYEMRLGNRYSETNPYQELLAAGVVLAGGSDAPITQVDPCAGIRAAVDHPVARHRVSRLEACRMFTDRAAYALRLEQRKGSLAPGHDADFVVLSDNPLQTTDFSIVRVFRQGQELPG